MFTLLDIILMPYTVPSIINDYCFFPPARITLEVRKSYTWYSVSHEHFLSSVIYLTTELCNNLLLFLSSKVTIFLYVRIYFVLSNYIMYISTHTNYEILKMNYYFFLENKFLLLLGTFFLLAAVIVYCYVWNLKYS